MISARTKLCLVIGDPIAHSLSPLLHNAAYQAAGLADQFVFAAARVAPGQVPGAIAGMRALDIRGMSCTIPHKQAVIPELDRVDPLAQRIGAVNTVVKTEDELVGYNTDVNGVVAPLKKRLDLKGKRTFLAGAGGAARAVAFGLIHEGVDLTIASLPDAQAAALAAEVGARAVPWAEKGIAREFHIIFNATPVGMAPNTGEAVFTPSELRPGQIVFDAVYTPYETQLLKNAAAAGAEVIHGTEMFVEQAERQFELYTGVAAPRGVMEKILMEHYGIRPS